MPYVYDTSRQAVAQGDVMLVPIVEIPADAVIESAEKGQHIITHSETGHHHVIMERDDVKVFKGMDIFTGFLRIDNDADLVHLRDHHQHKTIMLAPGNYVIKRQRQPSPEGWVRATD